MSLTILYAEDTQIVADAVRDLLEAEGFTVELCTDGNAAMNKLAGASRYDLLLFDNDLPGITGLELTRYARTLPRRRSTPIVILSATDCAPEALRAGADLSLTKPDGINFLIASVRKLIDQRVT